MRITVRKWGNSAAVRIPVAVLEAAKLAVDDAVEVRDENGRIVIEPVHPRTCNLGRLLDGITRDNLHGEVDFGPEAGREAW
jgi:antitoxin MazE